MTSYIFHKKQHTRESNMELLRIASIIAIIYYHILVFVHNKSGEPIYQAMFLPLHVGVLLFVMISGYFHIKFSIKKLIMIIGPMVVYSIPSILSAISDEGYSFQIITNQLLFVSHSQYWYMRTYIGLFLLAPVINKYLDTCSNKNRIALIVCLLFIATWQGTTCGDPSLYAGKNIINFMLLYSIGDTFRRYNNLIKQIPIHKLILAYLLLNTLLVGTYAYFSELAIARIIYRLSYQYCSPILLLNSILVFFIFMKISIMSALINNIARSVLAIYLIHCNNVFFPTIVEPAILRIFSEGSHFSNILGLFILTIAIFIICMIIDRILTPIWILTEKVSTIIERKLKIEYN